MVFMKLLPLIQSVFQGQEYLVGMLCCICTLLGAFRMRSQFLRGGFPIKLEYGCLLDPGFLNSLLDDLCAMSWVWVV